MRRYSPPPPRTTAHLCAGIRPRRRAPRRIYAPVFTPAAAHHGDFHHAKQLLGMVFFMDATSVWANKTANLFAGIRPHGWWYNVVGIRPTGHIYRCTPYGRIKRRIHAPVFARTGWWYGMRRYSPRGCAFVV
jgi:hypothetical protein